MDAFDRLRLLSSDMDLEPAEEVGCTQVVPAKKDVVLTDAILPGGKRIRLLKTLLTSACERNCYYCPFRAGRNYRRETFKPEELAKTFVALQRAGIAEGMFLSSGMIDKGIRTQDRLIETAEILRDKLSFTGYLHLKIMPGAEYAQVERSMQLADRVSINLEAPNQERLNILAPRKQFDEELLRPLQWIEEIRRTQPGTLNKNGRWPSSVTQFVVGGAGESDLELLSTTQHLYRKLNLRRTYFSAFNPISDTPLESVPAESPVRQRRLYQASFLLRDYGFDLEELPLGSDGNLPTHVDPKLAYAQKNLAEQPLEINRATQRDLLRIPGIGPKGVKTILEARRRGKIPSLAELTRIGVDTQRAAPYILLNGKRPPYQKTLW
jgi:predicted DNA-binding helix-hairpin-helix protein